MKSVNQLYDHLRGLPWPALAGTIGDLAMYEALLAGCADRVSRGERVELSEVPAPDVETLERIRELRMKGEPSRDERELVKYFDLLEEIRGALGRSLA